jgi:hypothetical protein
MLENIQEAITGLLTAIGSILSPTAVAQDGFGPTQAGVTAIAILFAIPITGLAAKKVTSLIKGIRG